MPRRKSTRKPKPAADGAALRRKAKGVPLPAFKSRPGPGRPEELTRAKLESICAARATGMSVARVMRAHYLNRDTYYAWVERGQEDKAAGRASLYAEFSDRVPHEEARGELELLLLQVRGSRTGSLRHVRAAREARATLAMTRAGRYGQQQRGGRGELEPEQAPAVEPAPAKDAGAIDLGRLVQVEADLFRLLVRKARGIQVEDDQLRALMRKGLGIA